jgi:putative membrane protein
MIKHSLVIAVLGLTICSFAQTPTQTTSSTTSKTATMPILSDGQIAKVLVTLNESEVDLAKDAKSKTKNKDVKEFANMMITQHTGNEKDTKYLAKKDSISLADSDVIKDLKNDCKDSKKQLSEASAFDKVYVSQQVTMHQKALDLIDSNLLPNVKNADLRAHLEKTREAVATHLDHAKVLQQKLL